MYLTAAILSGPLFLGLRRIKDGRGLSAVSHLERAVRVRAGKRREIPFHCVKGHGGAHPGFAFARFKARRAGEAIPQRNHIRSPSTVSREIPEIFLSITFSS
jgi:hypothetical protein